MPSQAFIDKVNENKPGKVKDSLPIASEISATYRRTNS